jgi:hypothetical protein
VIKTKRISPEPVEYITRSILILRGQRVILDRELAAIYGSTTKRLNEQVKRNRDRFPEDFMFQLTAEEAERSRSQIATLNSGRGQNMASRRARSTAARHNAECFQDDFRFQLAVMDAAASKQFFEVAICDFKDRVSWRLGPVADCDRSLKASRTAWIRRVVR